VSATNCATTAAAGAVLAMAEHELNHGEETRKTLAAAVELSQTKLPKLESGDLGENWPEWLIAPILLREASTLIKTSKNPDMPDKRP
jgi:hypothetical protein